ncbi:MAG: hypothetical protein QOD77_1257 [Thermoplasmata archaeon]|jgi:hypothetical protein|nr:hypothetical protein [Thermoplasmata archaeon]
MGSLTKFSKSAVAAAVVLLLPLGAAASLPAAPAVAPPTLDLGSLASLPLGALEAAPSRASHGPLFEKNLGQWDGPVLYRFRAPGYDAFLTAGALVTVLHGEAPADPLDPAATVLETAIFLRFEGADPEAAFAADGLDPYYTNYFVGDPAAWRSSVPHFHRVTVHDLYPGIDLAYYAADDGSLEYDFIVNPGADPSAIRLRFEGADGLAVEPDGSLALATGSGPVRHGAPLTAQGSLPVANAYAIHADGTVGFTPGAYDPTRPLVIDPLVYSTYVGGSGNDYGRGIAVDGSGNAYIGGYTTSTNYPTVAGSYRTSPYGSTDGFVTKLNAAGSGLVHSTYIGGSSWEGVMGVAIDGSGSVYATGYTQSDDYPTTIGAYRNTPDANGGDVFITKVNAAGTGLPYSTYFGDDWGTDQAGAIAVDASGNAYITGTSGGYFPTTPGAYRTGGVSEEFVTKMNPTGTALVYSTLLGYSGCSGCGNSIALDGSGNAYVTGQVTDFSSFPVTAGAYDTTHNGGYEAYVVKLNAAGSGVAYSTYVGGSGYDYPQDIAVDSSGNAYVTGYTSSTNFPVTGGALQGTKSGGYDTFVLRLNAAGNGLGYSTYMGGSSDDEAHSIAVDGSGYAYVTGSAKSSDFPTYGSYQSFGGGYSDVFIAKVTGTGTLAYSTYLGGNVYNEYGYGVAVDGSGNAYMAGYVDGGTFPTTAGAYQTTRPGGADAVVAKVSAPTVPGTPTGLLGSCGSPHGTALSWTAPGNGGSSITSYRVYRSPDGVSFAQVGTSVTTFYTDVPTYQTSALTYRVSAVNSLGEGAVSATVARSPCDLQSPAVPYTTTLPWTGTPPTLDGQSWQDPYSGLRADVRYTVGSSSGGSDYVASTLMPVQPTDGQTAAWTPSWTLTTLSQGRNYVNVDAADRAGNHGIANAAWVVQYDTLTPTVSGATPIDTAWTNLNPTLSGVCFLDTFSGLANTVRYWVGSSAGGSDYLAATALPTQPFSGQQTSWCPSFQASAAALHQGDNHVTLETKDRVGNTATVQAFRIRYDNQAETVTGLTALANAGGAALPASTWQTDATPRFEWTASTPGTSPFAGYSRNLGTSSSAVPDSIVDTTDTFYEPGTRTDGTWYFTVRAKDAAGNLGPVAGPFVLKVDATAPTLPTVWSSTHPSPAAYHPSASPVLHWSASDATSGIDGYSYDLVTGTSPPALDTVKDVEETTTSASYPGLGTFGTWTFRVRAVDNTGNWGPVQSFAVNIDAIAPDIVAYEPTGTVAVDTNVLATARPTLIVEFGDEDGGADTGSPALTPIVLATALLLVDGVDIRSDWAPACAKLSPLCVFTLSDTLLAYQPILWTPGVHQIHFEVRDAAGNLRALDWSWAFEDDSAPAPALPGPGPV